MHSNGTLVQTGVQDVLRALALAAAAACAFWTTIPAAGLPEGRELLRNGDFQADPKKPKYWVVYGDGSYAHFTIQPPPAGSTANVLVVEVTRPAPRPWHVQLLQNIDAPLKKNETLYLTFDYKISEGYRFNCYWQKEQAPWPKFISFQISGPADGEWHQCAVAARVPDDMPPRATSLALHLGTRAGTIMFRNFSLTAYPPEVSPEDLYTTLNPVLGGDEVDEKWRKKAETRVLEVRTEMVELQVVRNGIPVAGAAVEVQQKSRDFHFGVEVPLGLLVDDLLDKPALADLKAAVAGVEDAIEKYRAAVFDPELFDSVSLREALTWRLAETDIGKTALDFLRRMGEKGWHVRGKALYIPAFRWAPPRCRQMTAAELRKALDAFVRRQATACRGIVETWDVVYGARTFDEIYTLIGADSLADAFKTARACDPNAVLALRDYDALYSPDEDEISELLNMLQWLKEQGAEVQVIALDARFSDPYVAPAALEKRLDRIAAAGVPIDITAFQVEAPNEKIQARRVADLLYLFFSHPAVRGVWFSGLWEPEMANPKACLYRRRLFTRKPAATVMEELLRETWRSRFKGAADDQGRVTFRAFRGTYTVVVEQGGKKDRFTLEVPRGDVQRTVDLAAVEQVGDDGANP